LKSLFNNTRFFIFRKMESIFLVTFITTLLFILAKFIEFKYFHGDETKPLKETVRDTLLVLVCALGGSYGYFQFQDSIGDFFNVVTEAKVLNNASTQVFTDKPNF